MRMGGARQGESIARLIVRGNLQRYPHHGNACGGNVVGARNPSCRESNASQMVAFPRQDWQCDLTKELFAWTAYVLTP